MRTARAQSHLMSTPNAPSQPQPSPQPASPSSTGQSGRVSTSFVSRIRPLPLLIALVSFIGAVLCAWNIAGRVGIFHKETPRYTYAFDTRNDTQFTFADKPVTLTDDRSDPNNQMLIVTYGDQVLKLRATIPGRAELPGLLPHADWMRLVRFGLITGRTSEQFRNDLGKSPDLPERLAIVTKIPRPGSDPETWGLIWIKDWTFEFHEFLPEGGFKTEKFHYPTHRRGDPQKPGELTDNTWQFQAALQLMSQQARERLMGKFKNNAFTALSWTLPLCAFLGSVSIFALAFSISPRKFDDVPQA